jgi:glycosyltransferase involved in cell wall biosynthesis
MNIAWLSWKDVHHPQAGGAERLGHEWRRRLVRDGHEVRHITARYGTAPAAEILDGVHTRRCGRTRLTHYPAALAYHARHTRRWADAVVEEVNTVPYFAPAPDGRLALVYFQLAREIWFHQMPLPVAAAGYLAEALYTRAQARRRARVITISEDSRRDLTRFGFAPERVVVAHVGIDNAPLQAYDPAAKHRPFTVLFHGSLRAMKRPGDAVRAFAALASSHPDTVLWISGGGDATSLRRAVAAAGLTPRVTFHGRISEPQKLELMRRASVLVATSVKEGWGLIVTEANSMGTPAIVYDVDGLRSAAVPHNWICPPQPGAMAARLAEAAALFADRPRYDAWCCQALESSRRFTHDASYSEFRRALFEA